MHSVKHFYWLLLVLTSCNSKPKNQSTSSSDKPYQVLRLVDHKDYADVDILIDSSQTAPSQLTNIGQLAQQNECIGKPCQVINMWTSQQAMELMATRNKDSSWRQGNWPYVCEHYPGKFLVSQRELLVYPFLDEEYKFYGGKKSRTPSDSLYKLN